MACALLRCFVLVRAPRRLFRSAHRGTAGPEAAARQGLITAAHRRKHGLYIYRRSRVGQRMNSIMEGWIQTCRRELLDRTLIWNQRHLLHALREFEQFYNGHRPHQGIANARPLQPLPPHRSTPRTR
ncbi:integrase core domain-containing protein [Streptomyces violaceusniger]|uniref:integrase core domain-containing protein n=1 Tax=Streptomyces violaceusniger TaxID=68280 RepID=UPI0031D42150